MLSQMVKIHRFSRASNLLIKAHRTLAQANDVGPQIGNRIKGYLRNDNTSVKELVEVYHHLAIETTQSSLFSLTEERILNLLTEDESTEEDLVSRYLPRIVPYDYTSLCHLFIEIASVGRRPTPLIRAAAGVLTKLPYPTELKIKIPVLIDTLDALVKLNYINRQLVAKLITDITETVDLSLLDNTLQCRLLRALAGLKWRDDSLMQIFYNYVKTHNEDSKKVNHNLVSALLYVTAVLNYQPKEDMKKFFEVHMKGLREDSIDRNTRKWLNYVWSLVVLGVADKYHFESVISDEFILGIQNPIGLKRFNHADVMKLLNIRAVARLERHLLGIDSKLINELSQQRILRGAGIDKFSSRLKNALFGLAKSEDCFRLDIHTYYGFVVDCECRLSSEFEFISLDDRTTLEDELNLAESITRTSDATEKKCALIYILFDESLSNYPGEPVAHKRILERILSYAGYKTVFLHESILSREKTSSDLSNRILETIKVSLAE